MIVLDTHVLVWMSLEPRRLGHKTTALLERRWQSGEVAASAMTFWEVAMLTARGRLRLDDTVELWRTQLLKAGLTELPVSGTIAVRATDLTGLPEDPMDRLIAATALAHQATLVTADERLLAWRRTLPRHDARD